VRANQSSRDLSKSFESSRGFVQLAESSWGQTEVSLFSMARHDKLFHALHIGLY
jgi:hypothetical protein